MPLRCHHALLLLALPLGLAACLFPGEARRPPPPDVQVARFEEIPTPFVHAAGSGETFPFSGAAVLDVEGDGHWELFVGGGPGQADVLLQYQDGALVALQAGALSSQSATYGATAVDLEPDGDTDLIVARAEGITLYVNEGQGRFAPKPLPVALPPQSVAMSVAPGDFDRDGNTDLYVSVFVHPGAFASATYNDPAHAKPNRLLRNLGNLVFQDVTDATGSAGLQNTFTSAWADLDADGWPDLVLSQNTGQVEVLRNEEGQRFSTVPLHTGYGFWMSMGLGDYDADGDLDLFFGNVGNTIPDFVGKGDLRDEQPYRAEWILLRNDGGMAFSDQTAPMGLTGFGFAWGAVFEDLNLDGRLDLLVAQNYLKWPPHRVRKLPGKALLQVPLPEGPAFRQVDALGLSNPYYAQSPLVVDLDGDGRLDVLWLNMDGPLRAFLNRSTGHFLLITLPDRAELAGTRVTVETASGRRITRTLLNNTGLMTDQAPELAFGLGEETAITRVTVRGPNGAERELPGPAVDRRLRLQLP